MDPWWPGVIAEPTVATVGAVQCQLKNVQQIQSSGGAFAAILGDGSVVTWGDAVMAGSAQGVATVVLCRISCDQCAADPSWRICSRSKPLIAFAAILGDGSVVTWGDAECGGDSGAVQGQLKHVQQIQASPQRFRCYSW